MRAVWLVVACVGCDKLFGLGDLSPPPIDGAPDAPPDAPVDVVLANHDEDVDGVDDAIDKCPGIADSAQPDSDGDGVGDRCDPHPDNAIDRIFYFDTFQTMSPRWTSLVGQWAIDGNGRMKQTDGAMQQNNLLLLDMGAPLASPTVDVIIEDIGEIDAGAYLITTVGGSVPEGIACYVDDRSFVNDIIYFENRPVTGTFTGYQAPLTGSGFPLRITAASDSTNSGNGPPLCTARRADGLAPAAASNTNGPPPVMQAHVALYTFQATATYSSITVYGRR